MKWAASAMTARVRRGIATGELSPRTDTESMSAAFTGFLWGLSVESRGGTLLENPNAAITCRDGPYARHGGWGGQLDTLARFQSIMCWFPFGWVS